MLAMQFIVIKNNWYQLLLVHLTRYSQNSLTLENGNSEKNVNILKHVDDFRNRLNIFIFKLSSFYYFYILTSITLTGFFLPFKYLYSKNIVFVHVAFPRIYFSPVNTSNKICFLFVLLQSYCSFSFIFFILAISFS